MLEEHNKPLNNDAAQVDPQLVKTVTAVVQALQADKQTDENAYQSQNSPAAAKTIDLIGLFFHILEKFYIVLFAALVGACFMGYRAAKSVPTYAATAKLYIVNPNSTGINMSDLQLGTALTLDY